MSRFTLVCFMHASCKEHSNLVGRSLLKRCEGGLSCLVALPLDFGLAAMLHALVLQCEPACRLRGRTNLNKSKLIDQLLK